MLQSKIFFKIRLKTRVGIEEKTRYLDGWMAIPKSRIKSFNRYFKAATSFILGTHINMVSYINVDE